MKTVKNFNNAIRLPTIKTMCLGIIALVILVMPVFAANHSWLQSYTDSSTCTMCHSSAANQIMQTAHWTWSHTDTNTGRVYGKNTIINNYCIAVPSNEPRCTSCHAGIGYKDKTFNFNDATKVDCLVCHDTTGTYKKFPTMAGAPWTGPGTTNFSGVTYQPVDLLYVARNVGKSSRATCGACHFFGGGGDAVKHGDLDSSLYNPSRELDVHMGGTNNFSCAQCHKTTAHKIAGTTYSKDYADSKSCETCHTAAPHNGNNADRLNAHTSRVGCQTCHIPEFARGRTTKMSWDWSTAGIKGTNGQNIVIRDENGDPIYDTQKGNFTWAKNVRPEYVWFNGKVDFMLVDDQIDPTKVVKINKLYGDINDPNARIMPVKHFRGKQPYDAERKTLVVPHLFGADTNAYWKSFNWTNAIAAGMAYVGREFSGKIGWVQTEMFWIQNHMVAPKENALKCQDCHVPRGRLNFAALGYPAERAETLQSMYGFEVKRLEVKPGSSPVALKWTGVPGNTYKIQYSLNLQVWNDAPNGTVNAGQSISELSWQETIQANVATRFYRIIRQPAQ
ncbi:MAG: tetrathionate reductase family octaheme c-type cytochrome [Verrucomicrobiae bacterium]|nr:tetrathionate reductase family octaheme c-type cytochrome [Verrucomicrobiae bacterium]